jgi:flagellar biosynthesis protein FliQ
MEAGEVIEICREAIYVLILTAAPMMIAALVMGLIVALLQALTQIQEATMTFVPKVLAMLFVLVLTMPYVFNKLADLNTKLQDKIVHIE